jgi:hypothetical protein
MGSATAGKFSNAAIVVFLFCAIVLMQKEQHNTTVQAIPDLFITIVFKFY